jgi:hypothetical protein
MFDLNDPANGTARVVKLSGSSLGSATTQIRIARVLAAVSVNSSGALVFQFANSEIDERAFYDAFFFSVGQYDENAAKSQANYFIATLANNPTAYTIEEIAFLAKTMVYSNWTSPVLMTWEQWENICRTNTVAFATLFSQLTPTGQPPTGTNPNDPTSPTLPPTMPTTPTTPNGGGTGIDLQQDSSLTAFFKGIPAAVWWSLGSSLLLFFLTRKLSKQ